jgi:hypothetical protein
LLAPRTNKGEQLRVKFVQPGERIIGRDTIIP